VAREYKIDQENITMLNHTTIHKKYDKALGISLRNKIWRYK